MAPVAVDVEDDRHVRARERRGRASASAVSGAPWTTTHRAGTTRISRGDPGRQRRVERRPVERDRAGTRGTSVKRSSTTRRPVAEVPSWRQSTAVRERVEAAPQRLVERQRVARARDEQDARLHRGSPRSVCSSVAEEPVGAVALHRGRGAQPRKRVAQALVGEVALDRRCERVRVAERERAAR